MGTYTTTWPAGAQNYFILYSMRQISQTGKGLHNDHRHQNQIKFISFFVCHAELFSTGLPVGLLLF